MRLDIEIQPTAQISGPQASKLAREGGKELVLTTFVVAGDVLDRAGRRSPYESSVGIMGSERPRVRGHEARVTVLSF